jgi:hypothetical protein
VESLENIKEEFYGPKECLNSKLIRLNGIVKTARAIGRHILRWVTHVEATERRKRVASLLRIAALSWVCGALTSFNYLNI